MLAMPNPQEDSLGKLALTCCSIQQRLGGLNFLSESHSVSNLGGALAELGLSMQAPQLGTLPNPSSPNE